MENDAIFEEIKNDFINKFFSLKKFFVKYQIIALTISFVGGIALALMSGGKSLLSDAVSNFLHGILYLNILTPIVVVFAYVICILFWMPSKVAKKRGHAYTNIIQLLNLAAIFTGVTWFIAAAWALFPSEKSLIDPLVGNVTGLGRRNAGDTIGAVKHGMNRGVELEKETDAQIDSLIDMRSKGLISDDEFKRKKLGILQRDS